MKKLIRKLLFLRLKAPGAALLLILVFGVCHALGWRQYASILSGTSADLAASQVWRGVMYIVLWFAVVLVVPILLLAAGLYALAVRWLIKGHHRGEGRLESQ